MFKLRSQYCSYQVVFFKQITIEYRRLENLNIIGKNNKTRTAYCTHIVSMVPMVTHKPRSLKIKTHKLKTSDNDFDGQS